MYSQPWILPAVLVAGAVIAWALRRLGSLPPRDVRDDAADRAQHPAGRQIQPAPPIRTHRPGGHLPAPRLERTWLTREDEDTFHALTDPLEAAHRARGAGRNG